jgi:protein SCO1/2
MQETTVSCVLMIAWLFGASVALAEEGNDPHAAHRNMLQSDSASVNTVSYAIPDVELVDSLGNNANLRELLADDKDVVVNFIFTTCTTLCPVITSTTLQMQRQLDESTVQPDFVTISIDPDYDSADVLARYASDYGADWTFLTGTSDDVMVALKAFDAYRGNKVNHFALTLMHGRNDTQWTRVEGLTSAKELADIWRRVAM